MICCQSPCLCKTWRNHSSPLASSLQLRLQNDLPLWMGPLLGFRSTKSERRGFHCHCSSPQLLLLLLLHDGLLVFAWHWWSLPDTPLRGFASWPFFSCVSSSGHVGVEAHSPGIGAVPPFLLPLLLVGWRHGPRLVPAALSLAALGSRRATSS